MASFGQMKSELQLTAMAKLLSADVGTLLNQANREEVEDWTWSFIFSSIALYTYPVQTAGTVSLTQYSPIVTGSGTAFIVPANTQGIFHVGTSNVGVPIASVQNPTQLTLAQPWAGASMSGTSYNIMINVYSVPGFQEIYRVRQIQPLRNVSRAYLNELDPARLAAGGNPSVAWADAGWDSSGNPQIELWQPPSAVLPYVVEGRLGATVMVNDTDLPQVPSSVLIAKTMWKVCLALFANNGDARYFSLAEKYETQYREALDKARDADTRRQTQHAMKGKRPRVGLDILAAHDVWRDL